ncbi:MULTISPECIES: hypothetical protein [Pantoea]|nr:MULTISPECIES: hypothetical protein [Pantoea]
MPITVTLDISVTLHIIVTRNAARYVMRYVSSNVTVALGNGVVNR